MDGPERSNADDEFDATISDLRMAQASSAPAPPARWPLEPRATARRRLVRRAASVSAGLLIVAVVLGSIPTVRDAAGSVASRFLPPSAPPLAPGSDLFYLLPTPPGVDVSLDGHTLARLPLPGDAHPLRLARGHHSFTWSSRIFPFAPAYCSISVPLFDTDTCPFLPAQQLPARYRSLAGRVVSIQIGVSALAVPDQDQFMTGIQTALDSISTTALIQPGERYNAYPPGAHAGSAVVAAAPLRATLSYHYVLTPGYPDPCLVGQPFIPCRAPGEDCSQPCTLPGASFDMGTAQSVWVAAEAVRSSWRYTALDGQVVADNASDAFDVQVAVLRFTWNMAGWHATPLVGYAAGLPAANDLDCDPARYWLAHNRQWAFMLTNPPSGAQTRFIADATPVDGCLVVLDPHPGSDAPAVFLERFGVLLAVNAAANGAGAGLPMADSAELAEAHQLAAQAQIAF